MTTHRLLVCEIHAPAAEPLPALEQIAEACARDVGQPLTVKSRHSSAVGKEPLITLHLPAELAASQHQVWCLACRLACFCPHARVSVLVSAASAFTPPVRRGRRRRQAA
ncbi:hypothetical protein [Oleiharenicola lentus]|uniref:hypothetical protein n=1 Tax=Oleiharenicola lentus TaxID=2508720 RepID=UPI003F67277B